MSGTAVIGAWILTGGCLAADSSSSAVTEGVNAVALYSSSCGCPPPTKATSSVRASYRQEPSMSSSRMG